MNAILECFIITGLTVLSIILYLCTYLSIVMYLDCLKINNVSKSYLSVRST